MDESKITCPAYAEDGRCRPYDRKMCPFSHDLNDDQLASLEARLQKRTVPQESSAGGSGGSGGSGPSRQELEEKHNDGDTGFTDVKGKKRKKVDKPNSKKGDKLCHGFRDTGSRVKFIHGQPAGGQKWR